MERSKVVAYKGRVESSDFYGELTTFRSLCEGIIKSVVKSGKWFGFCKVAHKNQVDIMSFENNKGIKLGSMIESLFDESPYKIAIYKYLLHDYACYMEQPIVKQVKNLNGWGNSYNKYIVTANPSVIAEWMGISREEAEKSYGRSIAGREDNEGSEKYPYVKLYSDKSGEHKVTRPRSWLDLSEKDLRIVPLFAYEVGMSLLYEMLSTGFYNVTFVKDSGQERDMCTCFNQGMVSEVYKGERMVAENFNSVYDGDFSSNRTLDRGYIRVFEVGSSIYNSPLRSINFARITGFKFCEPDMSCMYIDMESVLEEFLYRINRSKLSSEDVKSMVEMLDVFDVGVSRLVSGQRIESIAQLEMWANSQNTLLSTVFIRQLALFMTANPQWFKGYTGKPRQGTYNPEEPELPFEGGLPIGDNVSLETNQTKGTPNEQDSESKINIDDMVGGSDLLVEDDEDDELPFI